MPEARVLWEEYKLWKKYGAAGRELSVADMMAFERISQEIEPVLARLLPEPK